MSTDNASREELGRKIDAIETGYEFMLAYAAQGRTTDKGPGAGSKVRDHLAAMERALDGLGGVVREVASLDANGAIEAGERFFAALDDDAAAARSAIRLVASRPDVSSQLVDNLNASIHLRAVLTDLFVIDEALKRSGESA